jgi:hypothetical protein
MKINYFNCSVVQAKARNILLNIQRENLLLTFEVKCHIQALFYGLMLDLHYEVKFDVL